MIQRILIIKPSSLGDVVHALPVLAGLRAAYPEAHIAWLVGTSFAPLLEGHPLLDEIIRFDRRHYGKMLRSPRSLVDFVRFVLALRRRRFDLVLDLQGLFRSGFLSLASGARRRVGFADAREMAGIFYNHRVQTSRRSCHAVEVNLCMGRELGLKVDPPSFPLGLRPEELAAARRLLSEAHGAEIERFTAVIPGARWDTKRWRSDRLGELIDRMAAGGLPKCVLLGGPDDRSIAEAVRAAARVPVVDLVGRTSLRELAAVLSLADLVVCQDSGPMHLAAALDKPLVAIFGPTNPARTGPYCPSARVVSLPLECSPCYRRQCSLRHHNCMEQLDVSTVFESVRRAWAEVCRSG